MIKQRQKEQLQRTHSEGDGAERAKNRSNAIDKATETTLETPLTIACANGHRDIVELLLKEGANIEHRDKKGFSPLIIASTAGHAPVVDLLLKNHAAIEAQSDRTKDTAQYLACSGGRKEVVELLLARNVNKEHRNVSDYTPLALASSGGYLEIVNMLVAAGAEINSRLGSKLGISPLMLAAMNRHRDATRVLLEKGSDINAQIETNRNTALTLASFQGRSDVVKLLLDNNANVEHRAKTGLTPLMECASGGYVDVGMLLIHGGADSNASLQSTSCHRSSGNTAYNASRCVSSKKHHSIPQSAGSGDGGDDPNGRRDSETKKKPDDLIVGTDLLEVIAMWIESLSPPELLQFQFLVFIELYRQFTRTGIPPPNHPTRRVWSFLFCHRERYTFEPHGQCVLYCPVCRRPFSLSMIFRHLRRNHPVCHQCLHETPEDGHECSNEFRWPRD